MMPGLALWQKVLNFAGQLAIFGGALWALYMRFVQKVCPAGVGGWLTPYGLMFIGVALAVLPLAPIPGALWLKPWLRKKPAVALVWYILALAGCVWAAFSLVSNSPQLPWGVGLLLALSWWFLATDNGPTAKQVKKEGRTDA
jgi:hypothetical protein